MYIPKGKTKHQRGLRELLHQDEGKGHLHLRRLGRQELRRREPQGDGLPHHGQGLRGRPADQGRQRPSLHRRGHRGFGEGHRRIPQESQLAGGRQKEVRKHAKTNNAECSPYRAVSRTGSRAKIGSGYFYALENIMKFKIDRTELPYDAMVADPSWLIPYEEEGETTDDEETEELQTDTVHGEGLPLR